MVATALSFGIFSCSLALADTIGSAGGNLGPGGNTVTVAGDVQLGFGKKPGPLEISIATEDAYWGPATGKGGYHIKNVDYISIGNADGRPVDLQGPRGTANEFQNGRLVHLQVGGCNVQQPSEGKDQWGRVASTTYCGELPSGNYHLVFQRTPAPCCPTTTIIVFTNGDGYTRYTGGPAESPKPAQTPEMSGSPEPAESPGPAETPDPGETQSP
jgi:hypothetical protein